MERRETGDWDFAVREERAGWRRLADREAGLKVKELLEGSANAGKVEEGKEVPDAERPESSSGPVPRDSASDSGRVNPIPSHKVVRSDRTSRIPRPIRTWPHSNSLPPARSN